MEVSTQIDGPSMGFYLSFTREPVVLPEIDEVRRFLPPYRPFTRLFQGVTTYTQGIAVLGGAIYSHFRYQVQLAGGRAALLIYSNSSVKTTLFKGCRLPSIAIGLVGQVAQTERDWEHCDIQWRSRDWP
jgi:hypothetical protein